MSRRISKPNKVKDNDLNSQQILINLFIHKILSHGKKNLSYRIVYDALEIIQKRTRHNPTFILSQAVQNVSPTLTLKAKRKSGSTYQVPIGIQKEQAIDLAIQWILIAAQNRLGPSMAWRFSSELIDAARKTGNAMRKREETHKMAEANKAFAHYR